jgi:hypothetical protein
MCFKRGQAGCNNSEKQKNDPQLQSCRREAPGEEQQSKENKKQAGCGMFSEKGSHKKSLLTPPTNFR